MKKVEMESILTTPLYWTFHLGDLENFDGLSPRELEELRKGRSLAEISAMVKALAWANSHPEEDFSSLLPNLPYSNDLLHRYLKILYRQLSWAEGAWHNGEAAPENP
jgi:hypothetical protein